MKVVCGVVRCGRDLPNGEVFRCTEHPELATIPAVTLRAVIGELPTEDIATIVILERRVTIRSMVTHRTRDTRPDHDVDGYLVHDEIVANSERRSGRPIDRTTAQFGGAVYIADVLCANCHHLLGGLEIVQHGDSGTDNRMPFRPSPDRTIAVPRLTDISGRRLLQAVVGLEGETIELRCPTCNEARFATTERLRRFAWTDRETVVDFTV